ncbi:MAG TPA: hypothetical protein VGD54_10025, partial [Steroidobacteraceae bacterium]
QVGALGAAALNFGGIVGSLCFGRLIDRLGPFGVISAAYLGGTAVVVIIGLGAGLNSNIYWFAALTGFFCIGAQLCAVAMASSFYATNMRATGVGWAMGAGRVGAIVGPLVGGQLLRDPAALQPLVVVLAATSLAAALSVFGMGRVALATQSASRSF